MTKNTNYTSDAMNFIKQMNENIPNLASTRENLRSTFWDKDFDEINNERELDKDNLKIEGYVYFSYKK